MIDNFNQIYELIDGKSTDGEFYFTQVIKRRKDNPTLRCNAITISVLCIKNAKELLKYRDKIIELCESNNARAYININKRSYKQVALETNSLIARSLVGDNFNIQNSYESCCGKFSCDTDKKWILDFDDDYDLELAKTIVNDLQIEILHQSQGHKDFKIKAVIPTKNGVHLITNKFNVLKFRERYTMPVDIKKDSPTVLYIP